MPHILERGLTERTMNRLNKRAQASGRSLQQEVKDILDVRR